MKIIFLLLLACPLFSQTNYDEYEKHLRLADSLSRENIFGKAQVEYDKALRYKPKESSTTYFRAAKAAHYNGNYKTASNLIKNGIVHGGAELDYLLNFEGFSDVTCQDYYKSIVNEYEKYRQEYFCKLQSTEAYIEIEKLNLKDQLIRKFHKRVKDNDFQKSILALIEKEPRFNNMSEADVSMLSSLITKELMREIDNEINRELILLTEKYGYQDRAWTILWHRRDRYSNPQDEFWSYFKPIINQNIKEGNLSKNYWEMFDWFDNIFNEVNKDN